MVGNQRANQEITRLYSRSVTGQNKRPEIHPQSSDYASKYDSNTGNRRRRSQKTSHSREKSKNRQKTKSNHKVSSFEQFEEIRFSCYEFNLKLNQLGQSYQAAQDQATLNASGDAVSIPLDLWNAIVRTGGELKQDFEMVQKMLTDNHEN